MDDRPCDVWVWHTDHGCASWECKPLQTIRIDDELKPCPFCGSTDIEIAWYGKDGEAVICLGCGGTGSQYTDRAKAIAAWNRRVDDEHTD